MPYAKREKRPCRLCLGPVEGRHRGWCVACHLALARHEDMTRLLQPHKEIAPRRAADPARLARIALYEVRAALGLPLFPREEASPWTRR